MITQEQIPTVIDRTVFDVQGRKVGEVKHVFIDDATGRPEWLCLKTGLFGAKETFVPVDSAELIGDRVQVEYDQERIKDAPHVDVDADGHLSGGEEQQLYRYYNLHGSGTGQRPGHTGDRHARPEGDRDAAMTRSEQELRVGTESHERGRARLRKYVVTEQEQVNVPVSREELRVEREPITDANRDQALHGPDISEAEHEVVLREERPTVDRQTVPRERVRVTKDRVGDSETVSGEVRKERIDLDDDVEGGPRR